MDVMGLAGVSTVKLGLRGSSTSEMGRLLKLRFERRG
jgi:hypothetical protein